MFGQNFTGLVLLLLWGVCGSSLISTTSQDITLQLIIFFELFLRESWVLLDIPLSSFSTVLKWTSSSPGGLLDKDILESWILSLATASPFFSFFFAFFLLGRTFFFFFSSSLWLLWPFLNAGPGMLLWKPMNCLWTSIVLRKQTNCYCSFRTMR